MKRNLCCILIAFAIVSQVSCSVNPTMAFVNRILTPFNFQIALVRGSAKYSGCDFDLVEREPSILEYLSDECKKWSVDKESDEYKLLLQEAHAFADFESKLSRYEQMKDPNTSISSDGSGIPQKQWAFRNEIYSKNHFFQCIKPGSILTDIMNCVINLRKNMSDSIVL